MTAAIDIEIYIPNLSIEEAAAWLSQEFSEFNLEKKKKGIPKNAQPFRVTWSERSIFGIIYHEAVEGFTSIWLDSIQLPWSDDENCAKSAAKSLDRAVRYTAGGWQQAENPDAWFEVTPEGKKSELNWNTQ